MTNKEKDPRIQIPAPMKIEVDNIVKTGLYSNHVEFVNDAVRRLIIQNKTEEKSIINDKSKTSEKENLSQEDRRINLMSPPP